MFAVATFGSHCRNDSDLTSDRDLLLVCSKRRRFRIAEMYERKGYSVSSYTPNQLRHMKHSGSLFLQHVNLEAIITHDADGHFQQFLDSCHLVAPSQDEIFRCESSIAFVLSWPSLNELAAWKIDCLYCLVRDYFIKLLASRQVLAFGVDEIDQRAREAWQLPCDSFWGLRRARVVKNLYRSGVKAAPEDGPEIVGSLMELLGCVNGEVSVHSSHEITQLCLVATEEPTSNYLLLRTLEAANAVAEAHGLLHPRRCRMLKLIHRPNAYGSSSRFRRSEIAALLEEVVGNLVANKVLQRTPRFVARP